MFFQRKRRSPAPETNRSTIPTSTSVFQSTPTQNLGLQIPLSDIDKWTNGFDASLVIGHGGFGKVYSGVLRDGSRVAVKRLSSTSRQGIEEFRNELAVLSRIRHRHLVSLLGYCHEEDQLMLVYEYMPRGSFRDRLYGPKSTPPLTWKQRLEVCIGAARGLHHLHVGSRPGIIHRDMKSSNILLGEDYTAKLADFGFSMMGPTEEETHMSTRVIGTFGYIDPAYAQTGHVTPKTDVYSFGVLLMEALCGRSPMDRELMDEGGAWLGGRCGCWRLGRLRRLWMRGFGGRLAQDRC